MSDYIIALFLLLIGSGCIYAGLKVRKLSGKTKTFITAPFESLTVSVTEAKLSHEMRDPYTLSAVYSYSVNGIKHEGKMVYDMELIGTEKAFYRDSAEKEKKRLETLDKIWYNPEKPSESFLKKSNLTLFKLLPLLGYLLCGGAMLWFLVLITG